MLLDLAMETSNIALFREVASSEKGRTMGVVRPAMDDSIPATEAGRKPSLGVDNEIGETRVTIGV